MKEKITKSYEIMAPAALKLPGRIVSVGYSFRKCLIYRFATAVVNHFHLV